MQNCSVTHCVYGSDFLVEQYNSEVNNSLDCTLICFYRFLLTCCFCGVKNPWHTMKPNRTADVMDPEAPD